MDVEFSNAVFQDFFLSVEFTEQCCCWCSKIRVLSLYLFEECNEVQVNFDSDFVIVIIVWEV